MKRQNWARILVAIVFIGLMFVPWWIREYSSERVEQMSPDQKWQAVERHGFFLEDVTETLGINFIHQAPTLDPKVAHIEKEIASMGAAVSVSDFNNDGWLDVYLTNSAFGSLNSLYQNQEGQGFIDIAQEVGLAELNNAELGVSMGAVWGDFNNDGFEDVFVYRWGKPQLFQNEEGTRFTPVHESDFPDWLNANSAIWLDFNNDGLLDLFVGGYYPETINLWKLDRTTFMPESFEYATDGGRNYLFRNTGNGFEEIAQEAGLISTRWTLAASAADINDDGYIDLLVANDYGVDELYLNVNGRGFKEIGEKTGIASVPKSGMNAAFADVFNQGKPALYITNISEPGILMQGNSLWVPRKDKNGQLSFRDMAGNLGIKFSGWSYGGQFGDLNNDGFLDLYVAAGFISADPNSDYWYDYSKISGGNESIISDAKNWPALGERSHSGYQNNVVWVSDGAGSYQDKAAGVGAQLQLDSRAVAFLDWDKNGSLDIVVANQRGPATFYKNSAFVENKWIGFQLKGTKSNTSAIGAKIIVVWNGNKQVQTIHGGSGFSAQNMRTIHIGLGKTNPVDYVEIHWPSGQLQRLENPPLNTYHSVTEKE